MKSIVNSSKALIGIYRALHKSYGPQGWWPGRTPFEVIVGAILTQNTAWTNVEKAIRNLKKYNLLSPRRLKKIRASTLARHIRPAGYYNLKSKRLKAFMGFLFSEHGGILTNLAREKTGNLRRELLAVNGIGPETCDSILLYAFGRPIFVIDAYTKRIFSRHKFFKEDASYDEAQKFFMDHLPRDETLYNEYHALLVRTAKECCRKAPRCKICPLKGVRPGASR